MRTTTLNRKTIAGLAATVLLAGPLAACSSSSDDTTSSSKTSSSSSAAKPATPPKAVAVVDPLTGESTAIKLDKGFTDALTALKLTPGVVGSAKLQAGSLIFPITGGNVTVFKQGEVSPYVIGEIQHEGSGLSLSAGGTKVELTNFNVDPGSSKVYGDVTVNGKVAATSAFLFSLDGRTLKPLAMEGSNAVLEGTRVAISPVAAPVLNKVFKTNAVKPGLLVGIAKITVATK